MGNKKRRSTEQCQKNYQRSINRIMRLRIAVGRKMQISADLIKIVNQILNYFFDKIAGTGRKCCEKRKRRCLSGEDILTSIRLILPVRMFKIFKRGIDAMKRVEDINRMSEMGDAIEELRRMVEAFEESFIIVELKLGLWLSLVKYYNHIAS